MLHAAHDPLLWQSGVAELDVSQIVVGCPEALHAMQDPLLQIGVSGFSVLHCE
jgi:hypothetical protein